MKQNQQPVRKPNSRSHAPARPVRKAARRPAPKRRRGAAWPAMAVAAFCALALFPVIKTAVSAREAAPATADAPTVERAALPQVSFVPQATPTPTPAPTPTPEPTATPEPTPQPTATPAPTPVGYLPVVHRANIESKKIAVTVDDCYQPANLRTIVDLAVANGAKLTLFPVGENLSKSGMPELMKRCAFELGFELENHTWSHSRIFRMEDEEMAGEIWKQDAALNRVLGADYQEHFLRLMGGDGDTDPRVHSYLAQLGYLGIANWSVSGSDSDMAHIQSALSPGQIYLFHTTDADTAKLTEFIPWAVSQGYKLVTLNELFKLPANEVTPLTDSAMPQPIPGVEDGHTITEGEYTLTAVRLQDSLRALGYLNMDGASTGYFGPKTVEAIARYQQDNGLEPTGEADAATQRLLLDGV